MDPYAVHQTILQQQLSSAFRELFRKALPGRAQTNDEKINVF